MDKRSLIFVAALAIALFFINQWFGSNNPPPKQIVSTSEQVSSQPIGTAVPEEVATPAISHVNAEQFYVLENDYQQVVFSNVGGAIAEINLPFESKTHPLSYVRPIHIDKVYAQSYAYNDHFPAFPYFINDGTGIKKVDNSSIGGYYPLLRRTIFNPRLSPHFSSPTAHYALKVVSDSLALHNNFFTLKRLEKDLIEFELVQQDRKITKTFRFPKVIKDAPYCIETTIKIDGDSRGLWLTSGVPEVELISDSAAPALKYTIINSKQKSVIEQISLPKECSVFNSIAPNWVATSNGFFTLIIDPLTDIPAGMRACKVTGTEDPTRLTLIDSEYQLYPAEKYPGYEIQLPLTAKTMEFRFYAGPLQDDILKRVDETYTNPLTGYNPQYISALSFQGWFTFISEPFAKFLFVLMTFFYKITSSWGISIILLTIALRIMLYPLNAWSIKSTLKMQEVAPKVSAIQEKYKKEPKKAQMEIMTLYREKGVNPLSGCFPLLIQLPFLIGMFDLLKSTFELRGASFIPGWIDNLTSPDVLFSWNYPIIFFGTDFHLLPFLLGAVMWFQQRFSASTPKDKSLMTDQQKQQRMMGNIMTIVFTVMFYHFPSGLNLYWLSSMALGILQQWFMNRKMKIVKNSNTLSVN